MAESAYVETLFGGLDALTRKVLAAVFQYVLRNLRFGHPDDGTFAENFQAYYYDAVTPAVADQVFAIAHNLGAVPYLMVPVLRLDGTARQLVPLTVAQAPDAANVYLKSPTTNAPITVLLEA